MGYKNSITDIGSKVGINKPIPTEALDVVGSALVSGNVGIGTTSPVASLQVGSIAATATNQVVGKARIVGTNFVPSETQMGTLDIASNTRNGASPFNQGFGPSLTFSQTVSGYVEGYEYVLGAIKTKSTQAGNTGKQGAMSFYTHNGTSLTEKLTIIENGNVGIGTTTPGYKLDVFGSIKASVQGRFANGSAATPSYSFDADSDSGMFRATTNALGFSTAASERMRITSAGNVGIGTTSPNFPLEIATTGYGLGVKNYITSTDVVNSILVGYDSAAVYLGVGYGSKQVHIASSNTGDVKIRTTGNTIIENGNVGIGTTAPSEKLEVNGNIKADGSVQVGDDNNASIASNVGAMRYRTDAVASYADMSMETAVGVYNWVNIVTNTF